jgi:hypothetical protein
LSERLPAAVIEVRESLFFQSSPYKGARLCN